MQCYQCGNEVPFKVAWLIDVPDRQKVLLCGQECARAWIGADRPLTRRVRECSTVNAIPQDVVVCAHDRRERESLSMSRCTKCGLLFEHFALA